jgi:response regulator RpfG family c-di-GMP phosphodiesterase
MPAKILFVDDDPNLLAALQRSLRKRFVFDTALGGVEALRLLETAGPYAVVIADMNMPVMNGIELLERVRRLAPDSIRLMLTGNADQHTAVEAVNRGAVFRFLSKPCPPEELEPAIEAALKLHETQRIERELIEGTLAGSVRLLTDVLGMVAPEALGRGQQLRESIGPLARFVGAEPLWEIELAALLSNIGYAIVPPGLLRRLGAGAELGPEERAILLHTPRSGHDLLAGIPRLQGVAQIIHYQSAHYDGTGFPDDGLAGLRLPVGARLLKILNDRLDLEADGVVKMRAFDVMRARVGFYDPGLLEKCFLCLSNFMVTSITADRPVHPIHVRELQPGDVTVSDVLSMEGINLIRAGTTLNAIVIQRLGNFAALGDVREPLLIQRAAAGEDGGPTARSGGIGRLPGSLSP